MHLMTSTTSSAKVSPGGKTAAGKTPITKQQILILSYVAGAILLVVGLYIVWKRTRTEPPRMDDPTPAIVHYIMTKDYEEKPFDWKAQVMKLLDTRNEKDPKDPNKGREIDKAFEARQINETEYRAALQLAWYGKHLSRVD